MTGSDSPASTGGFESPPRKRHEEKQRMDIVVNKDEKWRWTMGALVVVENQEAESEALNRRTNGNYPMTNP